MNALKTDGQLSLFKAKLENQGKTALNLQGARIGQNFSLKNAQISGMADLRALQTGGQLSCIEAEFQNSIWEVLNLEWANIGGGLLCCGAKFFGMVNLRSLKTPGQLNFAGAELRNPGGNVLIMRNADIGQTFFLIGGVFVQGDIDLTAATCGDLEDDADCWPGDGQFFLNGFTYRRLHGPTDARTRLDWIARGERQNGEFFPQPYKQLAKVLDEMGHEADAREVLYALSRKLGEERRKELLREIAEAGQSAPGMGLPVAKRLLLGGEHIAGALLRIVVGYGYKPFRSLAVLAGLITAFWIATIGTWHAGDFAPNSAVMLQHADWTTLPLEGNAAKKWTENTPSGRDWESFHSLAYAADVVIPIIEFGQTDAWAPSTERGWWGKQLWWLRWVFTTLGWIATALGAAAITGIIRRE